MHHEDDTAAELDAALARAELAARWLLRNGAPSPEHYAAVMAALNDIDPAGRCSAVRCLDGAMRVEDVTASPLP